MKMIVGFIIGAITIFGIMVALQFAVPVQADETSETTLSIMDIEKINREALITPLREAEKTITDPDIANYYHTLLERCDIPEEEERTTTEDP